MRLNYPVRRAAVRRLPWLLPLLVAFVALPVRAAPFSALMFEDAPSLDPQQLLPVYRDELGTALDDALVARLERRLVDHYRAQGYLAPAPRLVRMHPQGGVLVMEMREPRVARIDLDGGEQVKSPQLAALLRDLRSMRPLGRQAFESWLERAGRLGVDLRGTLVGSSAEPHLYVASLRLQTRRWQGVAHLDNRGPAQLGHEIAQLSVSYRWPREVFGQLRVDVAAALDHERLRYAGLAGSHRVRARGDALRWRYARSESTLPVVGTARSVDYDRGRAELGYVLPLARKTRQRSDLSLALRSYDLDQYLDDGRHLRRDRIRALQLGYDLVLAPQAGGRHDLEVTLSQGIDALGASLWPDGADADFTSLNLAYEYRGQLTERWHWFGNLSLQASADRLPASERFFIGGRELGGAFDPATLSGDQGLGARLGLERMLSMRFLEQPLTAYAYYDHGWVWSHEGARPADDAGSAGAGVQGQIGGLAWSLELGVPVRKPETPTLLEDDARVFFSLTQRF